jgi:hypothetical protein
LISLYSVHAYSPVIFATNSTSILRSYDAGSSFIEVYTDSSYDFDRIVTSNDGKYVYAISNKNYNLSLSSKIKYSKDYGNTWQESVINPKLMTDIAISDDGKNVYITNCTAIIWSHDYGNTWNSTLSGFTSCSLGDNRDIVTTSNGSIIYFYENQGLKKSTNYGVTFSSIHNLTVGQYEGLCTSEDGSIIYAYPYNAQPLISNNSGATFYNGEYSGMTLIWKDSANTCYNHKAIVGDTSNNLLYSPTDMQFGTGITQSDAVIEQVTNDNQFANLYKINNSELFTSIDNGATWNKIFSGDNINWIALSENIGGNTVPVSTNFAVTLDTINAVLQDDGAWFTYPYGIPLQSYATVKVSSGNDIGYIGITCNYNESAFFSDTFEYQNLSANGWTAGCKNVWTTGTYRIDYLQSLFANGTQLCGALTKSVGEMQNAIGYEFTFTLLPVTDGYIEVSLNNYPYGNQKVANVILDLNAGQLCVYDNSKSLPYKLFCQSYNQLTNGDIKTTLNINNFKATYTIAIETDSTDKVYSQNLPMLAGNETNPQTIGFVSIETSSAFTGWLDNLNITKNGYFPTLVYTNFTEGIDQYFYQGCPYAQLNNIPITIRTYYQPTNIQVWNNYHDIHILPRTQSQQQVDSNTTGAFDQNTQDFIDNTFGTGLSTSQKLFYTLITTIIAVIMIIILGVWSGMPPALTGGLAIMTIVGCLILFAFMGFIPVWIIILIGIIGAGVIAMMFKSMIVA